MGAILRLPKTSYGHNKKLKYAIEICEKCFTKKQIRRLNFDEKVYSHTDIHPTTIKTELINNYVSICLFSTGQSVSKKV